MAEVLPLSNRQLPPRRSPAEMLVYSTVRIECDYGGGGHGTGTGFFFAFARREQQFVPAIVTNKHVIECATRGAFHLHLRDASGMPSITQSERFEIDNFQKSWIPHPDATVDLCVMPIAGLMEQANQLGKGVGFIPLEMSLVPTDQEFVELTPLEEVLMVGYPNGIWDSKNNMPILRRGVTATHPGIEYEGRREFMIDAACFPGSSGSPVLLYNTGGYYTRDGGFALGGTRIKLLGILYAGPQHTATGELQIVAVPTRQEVQAISRIPNNLGLVIQSSRLRYFEEQFMQLVPKPA
ncbi:zinc chelation protein : Uncharacterized protein OS=Desulfococcus oleovorans (strain DSM 6200 / Hxd3) GN=Dole_0900 PE=4 SV=1: Trypsin_2 [Gemmataceae bacterium]|nr:zinc chelation protein : Uncharacterized protein OS=Desulfococcus oleovorans (strain DSM 6200 / Hxd3) GN=Dole_0900 PE=4 SV=1: Trypsin_2 [Gemmataceae bacterium]VTU02021.1 zinc chelation protein : Uncharacterized protein OS=Desulfococcus oleovorans (strain DSM 6200 / Hxd3) GN=Dole_0900 PE=4 SV=1: Trypsin_2 [Gemmataceae bacterium]